jgi:hypothetical protein
MMRPSRCSSPCSMHKIIPLHRGAPPNNQAPGMLFLRCIPSPLFAHLQLYLMSLTLSYQPPAQKERMLPIIFCTCLISLSVSFCVSLLGRGDCTSVPYLFGFSENGQCCICCIMCFQYLFFYIPWHRNVERPHRIIPPE